MKNKRSKKSCCKCSEAKVVINEMLSGSGKSVLPKVLTKDKPGKYSILMRILAECFLRMEIYAGTVGESTSESKRPTGIVKRLAEPLRGTGRNVLLSYLRMYIWTYWRNKKVLILLNTQHSESKTGMRSKLVTFAQNWKS